MEAILNIVVPVFGIILTGFLARRFAILGADSAEALNRFVYYIALPPLLFLSTARVAVGVILNWPFIAAYMGGIALTLIIGLLGGWLLFGHRDLATLTLHGMAAIFANTVYMGVPLFLAAYGSDGTLPILTAALVSNLLLIGAAIVCLEISRAAGGGYRNRLRQITGAVFFNPVVTPLLMGLAASALKLSLPLPLERFLELLANAAGPAALFTLGLSLYGHSLHTDVWEVGWLVLLKLLINPLLTGWLVYTFFALDPFWAHAAVLSAALPTGALVFVIAQRYVTQVQQSAAVIVVTTVLSVFTLSVLLARFGSG